MKTTIQMAQMARSFSPKTVSSHAPIIEKVYLANVTQKMANDVGLIIVVHVYNYPFDNSNSTKCLTQAKMKPQICPYEL